MNNIQNHIKEIYEKTGYLDKYGGSLVLTIVIFIIAFIIFSYYYIQANIKPLKANWSEEKCKPYVLPFAGLINPPKGKSAFEFTSENFNYCISSILKQVVGVSSLPLKYSMSLLTKLFGSLTEALQKLRGILNFIRQRMLNIFYDILNRIMNVVIQLRKVIVNMNIIFDKVKGVFMTVLYTLVAGYMTIKSALGAFLEIIIKIIIILAATAIIMWLMPWTWGMAATLTAILALISVPFVATSISLGNVLRLTTDADMPTDMPKKGCFDGDTKVDLKNGTKTMKNINPGDKLLDGSTVTAVFKIANTNTTMYKINDIIVTGDHMVRYKQYGWIKSSEYPLAIEINNYTEDFIYCLNTTNKVIVIDGFIFMDWDELDSLDIEKLKLASRKYIPNEFKTEHIHKYMDGGFIGTTKIELEDGRLVDLKDLEPNDQLKYGERVFAVVEIDASNIRGIKAYTIGDFKFVGGPNIRIRDNLLGSICTLDIYGEDIENINKLYHIVTDKDYFIMNGIRFNDYNGLLEPIIWNTKKGAHSY
jgi:hypothetical protein